jgi:hypothetical protein
MTSFNELYKQYVKEMLDRIGMWDHENDKPKEMTEEQKRIYKKIYK